MSIESSKILLSVILFISFGAPLSFYSYHFSALDQSVNFVIMLAFLVGILSFYLTYVTIPLFFDILVEKGIYGIDINKVTKITADCKKMSLYKQP